MLCHPTRLRSRSHRRRVPAEDEQAQAARPAEQAVDDEPLVVVEPQPEPRASVLFWLTLALLVAGAGLSVAAGVWWGMVAWGIAVVCVVAGLVWKRRGR